MVSSLLAGIDANDLRDLWQGRVLKYTEGTVLSPVVLSVLAHNYDEALLILMKVVFPGFEGIRPPGLCSAAKVDKTGAIVADVILRNGDRIRDAIIFESERQMQGVFRKLADDMKLSDEDRVDLFRCVLRWVVADRRLDPTMDPSDPDAKRLTVH